MPYKYIGKSTYYKGKSIWEIVGNLKNFGVGRVLVRSRLEHYSEPSFFRIKSVEPHENPDNPSVDNMRKVTIYIEKTFRGKRYPDTLISRVSYKTDYRLLPKDEEAEYCKPVEVKATEEIYPRTMPFPPLMRELIAREAEAKGEKLSEDPKLEIIYKTGVNNNIRIAKEGETPTCTFVTGLGTPASPSLYKGINLNKTS